MEQYFLLEKEWNNFLNQLKHNYPKYYQLKFASLSQSLHDLNKKLPENTSVVRYTYIDNQLFAIVITKNDSDIIKLNIKDLNKKISALSEAKVQHCQDFNILNNLYQQLWQPFENDIKTENVIIIPDQQLFNLSFEMLATAPVNSIADLIPKSLLNKHVISYNYSLFLIDKDLKTTNYQNNFVAFVPEFNDQMKQDYKFTIADSSLVDKAYLTLLPQPFTRIWRKPLPDVLMAFPF